MAHARTLAAVLLLLSFCASGQENATLTPDQEFLATAQLASNALSATDTVDSLDGAWSRLWALYQYRNASIRDSEVSTDWSAIEQKAKECLYDLSLIAEIDKDKPDGIEIFAKVIRENKTQADQQDRDQTIGERILAELGKAGLKSSFRKDEAALEDSVAALMQAGNRIARYQDPNLLSVDYLPAWQHTYDNDLVEVKNQSASDISNAALFVTVYDANGGARVHVHHIGTLQGNATLEFKYPYESGDYTGSEAVRWPARVDVALYRPVADALSVSTASRVLQGRVMDSIVATYLSDVKISGSFLGAYAENQTNQVYSPGFQFSFDGIRSLPVKEITVSFWNSQGIPNRVTWNVDADSALKRNTSYSYRSHYFSEGAGGLGNDGSPSHIAVTLAFYGTNYEKTWAIY